MERQNTALYLLVLVSIAGIVVIALGGGLFNQKQPWLLQWQHQAFMHLCHQIPERSFWIGGQPMAVCSRCFGIYTGFALGWTFLPVLGILKTDRLFSFKKLLIVAVLINIADIIGNMAGFWQNTLTSRLIAGGILGLSAAVLFSDMFLNNKQKSTGKHYGRITTTGI